MTALRPEFGDYIDCDEYDKSDEVVMEMLFTVARSSFRAGFLSAGGEAPKTADSLKYTRPSRVIPSYNGVSK